METKRTRLLKKAFNLEKGGVICLVGSGGKTSLMYRMASILSGAGESVLTTTTTQIMEPAGDQSPHLILSTDLDSIFREAENRLSDHLHLTAAFSRNRSVPGKLTGFPPDFIDELFRTGLFRWILVEADGSAGRPLKAPAEHEPVVPGSTGWIIGVAGLWGVGKPLHEDWVFRSGLYAGITGLERKALVTETSVALALTHKNGVLKGEPAGSRRIVFLNLPDESPDKFNEQPNPVEVGRKIVQLLYAQQKPCLNRVVIGKALRDPPVVEYHDLNQQGGYHVGSF